MVRSGGRGQERELWLEARLRDECLAASRRREAILRARSMRSESESEGSDWRSLSKERSREREATWESERNASSRRSTSPRLFSALGFCDGHGRFAAIDKDVVEGMTGEWESIVIVASTLHSLYLWLCTADRSYAFQCRCLSP